MMTFVTGNFDWSRHNNRQQNTSICTQDKRWAYGDKDHKFRR